MNLNPIPAAELLGVCLHYNSAAGRNIDALQEIDLRIPMGLCTAIVGSSGSGKSSLLRVLAGLSRPQEGTVTFARSNRPEGTNECAVLFQGQSHFPWLTIEENLSYRLRIAKKSHQECHARAAELCLLVGLDPRVYLTRFPAEVSGGQIRRVELAMALSVSPALLLLDEPTTGLDYLVKRDVQHLIEDILLSKSSTTVIVTHDVREAVLLADRVVILDSGRLVDEVIVTVPRPRIPGQLASTQVAIATESIVTRMLNLCAMK